MALPRISLVTISFNQAMFLRAAIDSVLTQNYPNLQYIVVDPGSTDGSRDIVNEYGDRISARVFEPDRGPGDGLNKGFALADGEIYGFLNADDVLLPGALHEASAEFVADPSADVISGHCLVVDEQGETIRQSYSDWFRPNRVIHRAANIMQPSTFFRRSAFEKTNGFSPSNRLDWDTELFLDLHASGARFKRCEAMWSCYRIYPTTITSQRRVTLLLAPEFRQLLEVKRGRKWAWFDHPVRWTYLVLKYAGNPRWIRERLLRGVVAGRFN